MNSTLPMEGSLLPFQMPSRFERFYRQHLRRVVGSRIRSSELMSAYEDWACVTGEGSMTFPLVRTCMEAIGHARRQSNGVQYVDVAFAKDYPEQPDMLPARLYVHAVGVRSVRAASVHPAKDGVGITDPMGLIAKVDVALHALLDLRQAISAQDCERDPASAAQRLLGLLDHVTGEGRYQSREH